MITYVYWLYRPSSTFRRASRLLISLGCVKLGASLISLDVATLSWLTLLESGSIFRILIHSGGH